MTLCNPSTTTPSSTPGMGELRPLFAWTRTGRQCAWGWGPRSGLSLPDGLGALGEGFAGAVRVVGWPSRACLPGVTPCERAQSGTYHAPPANPALYAAFARPSASGLWGSKACALPGREPGPPGFAVAQAPTGLGRGCLPSRKSSVIVHAHTVASDAPALMPPVSCGCGPCPGTAPGPQCRACPSAGSPPMVMQSVLKLAVSVL